MPGVRVLAMSSSDRAEEHCRKAVNPTKPFTSGLS